MLSVFPLFVVLYTYKPGLVFVSLLACFSLFFRGLNMVVNARGWKILEKHPNEFQEENPLQRVLVSRIGYWRAEFLQIVLLTGVPFLLMILCYGFEYALGVASLCVAALAPMSIVMFANDLRVVHSVEHSCKDV
jgi:hypothetical protein